MNEQANGGHECVFVEEQEPSGRLILGPCLTCDTSAMDALEQLRDDACGPVETDDHSVNDPRCDYAPATNQGGDMPILTKQDRDELCTCVTRNQHETAPSSACPLLTAGDIVERIVARHLAKSILRLGTAKKQGGSRGSEAGCYS